MLSPLEAGYMCLASYQDTEEGKAKLTPIKWEWVRHLSREFRGSLTFSALVFRCSESFETAIAIRGTVANSNISIADLRADLDILLFGSDWHFAENPRGILNTYLARAREMLDEVKQEFPNDKVTITGHSLGALVAEITAIESESEVRAITFDSPGSLPFVVPERINDDTRKLITTYLAAPHLINTRHAHLAKTNLHMVYIPDSAHVQSQEMTQLFNTLQPYLADYLTNIAGRGLDITDDIIQYSLRQHSLENIVAAINPLTQKPFHSLRVREWVNWRRGIFRQGLVSTGRIFAPENSNNVGGLADYLSGLTIELRYGSSPSVPIAKDKHFSLIVAACTGITLLTLTLMENEGFVSYAFPLFNLLVNTITFLGFSSTSQRENNYYEALYQQNHYRLHHTALPVEQRREPEVWQAYHAGGHALKSKRSFFSPQPFLLTELRDTQHFDARTWGSIFAVGSTVLSLIAAISPAKVQMAAGLSYIGYTSLFSPVIHSAGEQLLLDKSLVAQQQQAKAMRESNDLKDLEKRMDSFQKIPRN